MSRSIPLCKSTRTVNHQEIVREVAQELCLSDKTVNAVITSMIKHIILHLLKLEAVRFKNFFTFHLRRREYSPSRRAKFSMGKATLPPVSFYPYASMSVNLRQDIHNHTPDLEAIYQQS